MKRMLILLVALLAMVAFVGGVVAQEKKADQPAAAKAEKPKAEKPKAPKALRASGTVSAYDAAAKTLKVKSKDKEMEFALADNAKVRGEIKQGSRVTVTYKKEGEKLVASSVAVAAEKKAAAKPKVEKKEGEKKEEKK